MLSPEPIIAAIHRILPPEKIAAILADLPKDSHRRITAQFDERPVRRIFKVIRHRKQ
jgi:hypothetical protein